MFVYFIVTCLKVWNASGQITETSCTLTKQNTGLHLMGIHVNLQLFCPEGLNTRHFQVLEKGKSKHIFGGLSGPNCWKRFLSECVY